MKTATNNISEPKTAHEGRRPYQTPVLVDYGDVRKLTRGGTTGVAEAKNNNSNRIMV